MKVESNQVNSQLNVNSTKNQKVDKEGDSKMGGDKVSLNQTSSPDSVSFSEKAQAINKVKALAQPDLDTIREDKVAHFQNLIDSGEYNVDASAVADKLVDEHLMY